MLGFSYLEPKRHIPYVTDLDGEEARTFGEVLAHVTQPCETRPAQSWYTCTSSVAACPTCTSILRPIGREMP